MTSLPVVNLGEARFECTYGRGCEGLCCRNGRPPIEEEEAARIDANLPKFLPHMRPEARDLVLREGYVSRRLKDGLPMLRVLDGWCVFFHQGCVLHKVGAEEGDIHRYKPIPCALFPLERTGTGQWYVRQKGYAGEQWDLPCLDPASSDRPAAESLAVEMGIAERLGARGP